MKLPLNSKSLNLSALRSIEAILWIGFSMLLIHYVLGVPRLPVFWYDEAFMVEPAWHLATSGKCISTLLPDIQENPPFGMNYPLFSLLMAAWIKFFGFNLFAIRLLPFILMFCGTSIAVAALCRMGVIRGRMQVLLLLILWMLTQAAFDASHQARPESLTMLLVAIGLYTSTLGVCTGAFLGLFLLAALMPGCGLYMIFPVSIAVVVALASRAYPIHHALAVLLGLFVGSICFYLIYRWTGAWQSFQLVAATVGGLSIAGHLTRILESGELPVTLIQKSVYWLFSAVLCWACWHRKKSPSCWPIIIATSGYAAATLLSIGILANFSPWYGWLCIMPFMVAFVVFAFDCSVIHAWIRGGIMILLILLLLDNNMSRYLSYSYLLYWCETDSKTVETSLKDVTNRDDVVIGSESAYIALRPNVKKFYSLVYSSYLMAQAKPIEQVIPGVSAEPITVIIADVSKLHSGLAQPLQQWCGGEWKEIRISCRQKPAVLRWPPFFPTGADYFECCNYRVFRRVPGPRTY